MEPFGAFTLFAGPHAVTEWFVIFQMTETSFSCKN